MLVEDRCQRLRAFERCISVGDSQADLVELLSRTQPRRPLYPDERTSSAWRVMSVQGADSFIQRSMVAKARLDLKRHDDYLTRSTQAPMIIAVLRPATALWRAAALWLAETGASAPACALGW